MAWLMFAEGAICGALGIITPILIAWRQRVFQLSDRALDRDQRRLRELEYQERQARIVRREQWRSDHDAILGNLDLGESIAYRTIMSGPFTRAEFDSLGVGTFRINVEILAHRGIERMREPLLALALQVDELVANCLPDEITLTITHDQYGPSQWLFRRAVIQDRAAHDIAELTKKARQILREEWGD